MLIVSCTNRTDSNSLLIAGMYAEWLKQRNVQAEILDLTQLPVDFISTALYEKMGTNQKFNSLQSKMDEAEKVLFVVPEYNGSFPGVLKCFFDGLRYPGTFDGKKASFTGISAGPLGGAVAISHLTDIMHYYNVPVLPITPRIAFVDDKLDKANKVLVNDGINELIREQIDAFIAF